MTSTSVTNLSGSTNKISSKKSQLKSQDFINLMITQLQHQDPMDPTKNSELLTQMSQIGQLQSSTQLTDTLKTLTLQNQIASASSLIGKEVQGLSDQNDPVHGLVNSVRVEGDNVNLELDNGVALKLSRVTNINAPVKQAA